MSEEGWFVKYKHIEGRNVIKHLITATVIAGNNDNRAETYPRGTMFQVHVGFVSAFDC